MTDEGGHRDISELVEARHQRAEIVFGVLSFVFAVFLLTQIANQTSWMDNRRLVEQPAFWPIVSIAGMTVFGAFELWFSWRRNKSLKGVSVGAEVANWLKALEYVVWFLGYVWAVPIFGYLPTTLVLCAALSWRLGYRSPRAILAALLVGAATVILFKSFLSVRIPAGAVYEFLPDGIRNFMILYL